MTSGPQCSTQVLVLQPGRHARRPVADQDVGGFNQIEDQPLARLLAQIDRQGVHAAVKHMPRNTEAVTAERAAVTVGQAAVLVGADDRFDQDHPHSQAHQFQ